MARTSMVHLGTLVLSSFGGHFAPVGAFLHPPDCPAWGHTTDVEGQPVPIKGATVVDADDLAQAAICLVVQGREKAPLIAAESTHVWSLEKEDWTPLTSLSIHESIRVPEVTQAGTVVTWSKVKRVLPATKPDRLFLDANRMWGRLVLHRGYYSFASPCAFVHT